MRFYDVQPVSPIAVLRSEWGLNTAHLVEVSKLLYQTYWIPLQLLAVILMIPMVVVTGIVRRGQPIDARFQDRSKQVETSAEDRLTLVNVKAATAGMSTVVARIAIQMPVIAHNQHTAEQGRRRQGQDAQNKCSVFRSLYNQRCIQDCRDHSYTPSPVRHQVRVQISPSSVNTKL